MSGALHISKPYHWESRTLWYVFQDDGKGDFDTLASFESHEEAVIYMAELTQGRADREAIREVRIEREAARAAGEGKS